MYEKKINTEDIALTNEILSFKMLSTFTLNIINTLVSILERLLDPGQ